jgi:hypothetical protein
MYFGLCAMNNGDKNKIKGQDERYLQCKCSAKNRFGIDTFNHMIEPVLFPKHRN